MAKVLQVSSRKLLKTSYVILHDVEKDRTLPNWFHDDHVTLIPKRNREDTGKRKRERARSQGAGEVVRGRKNYRSILFLDIGLKNIINKILKC